MEEKGKEEQEQVKKKSLNNLGSSSGKSEGNEDDKNGSFKSEEYEEETEEVDEETEEVEEEEVDEETEEVEDSATEKSNSSESVVSDKKTVDDEVDELYKLFKFASIINKIKGSSFDKLVGDVVKVIEKQEKLIEIIKGFENEKQKSVEEFKTKFGDFLPKKEYKGLSGYDNLLAFAKEQVELKHLAKELRTKGKGTYKVKKVKNGSRIDSNVIKGFKDFVDKEKETQEKNKLQIAKHIDPEMLEEYRPILSNIPYQKYVKNINNEITKVKGKIDRDIKSRFDEFNQRFRKINNIIDRINVVKNSMPYILDNVVDKANGKQNDFVSKEQELLDEFDRFESLVGDIFPSKVKGSLEEVKIVNKTHLDNLRNANNMDSESSQTIKGEFEKEKNSKSENKVVDIDIKNMDGKKEEIQQSKTSLDNDFEKKNDNSKNTNNINGEASKNIVKKSTKKENDGELLNNKTKVTTVNIKKEQGASNNLKINSGGSKNNDSKNNGEIEEEKGVEYLKSNFETLSRNDDIDVSKKKKKVKKRKNNSKNKKSSEEGDSSIISDGISNNSSESKRESKKNKEKSNGKVERLMEIISKKMIDSNNKIMENNNKINEKILDINHEKDNKMFALLNTVITTTNFKPVTLLKKSDTKVENDDLKTINSKDSEDIKEDMKNIKIRQKQLSKVKRVVKRNSKKQQEDSHKKVDIKERQLVKVKKNNKKNCIKKNGGDYNKYNKFYRCVDNEILTAFKKQGRCLDKFERASICDSIN